MVRRPTQADVAKAAGVHRSSVSLSFRNHPSIPQATKKRILKCAKKLGYVPDPMLSALAAYRSQIRPKAYQGTIVWLTNESDDFSLRSVPAFRDYYEGALSWAKSQGFTLDTFELRKYANCKSRLASILRSRSIQGILLPPQPKPNTEIDFEWEDFSTVTFGFSLVKPQLHAVTAAQFRAAIETVKQLRLLGYRRIGLVFDVSHDEKSNHNFLGGYLAECHTSGLGLPVPPLMLDHADKEHFEQWYVQHHPDAIIVGSVGIILNIVQSLGIRIPGELGLASPLLDRDRVSQGLAGIYEESFHIGEVAMAFLIAMIYRGERGIPQYAQRVIVEGTWKMGNTVRRVS